MTLQAWAYSRTLLAQLAEQENVSSSYASAVVLFRPQMLSQDSHRAKSAQ
jgi:hypothetical protein